MNQSNSSHDINIINRKALGAKPNAAEVLKDSSNLTREDKQKLSIVSTLVTEGHKLYIEDFDNLKKVEAVNIRFLKLLNYKSTDTIYTRVIGGKSPENKSGKIMSLMKSLKDCNEKNNQNVYFVVNGGGQKGEDVKVGRALMLEIDKDEQGEFIPIDDQYKIMVEKFGIPTVAIFTGNKSLHCYYVYEEPIDTELWEEMQDNALAYFPIADQSIRDLPRILRLVGFKHSKTGDYSRVYAESGIKYSYDELRSKIPVKTVETKKKKPVAKNKKPQKTTKVAVPNTASELIKINRDTTPWSKMPYPPLDENGDLVSAKSEIPNLSLAKSLKLLTYEEIQEILTIKTALEILPEEYCTEYSKWRETLCTIKSAALKYPDLCDHLFYLAETWSETADNFDPEVFQSKWDGINIEGNLTTASLIKWAKDAVNNGSYNDNGETTFWKLFNLKYPWSYQNYKAQSHNVSNSDSEIENPFLINPDSCLTPEDFRSSSNILNQIVRKMEATLSDISKVDLTYLSKLIYDEITACAVTYLNKDKVTGETKAFNSFFESTLSVALANIFEDVLLYTSKEKDWYFFDGLIWKIITADKVRILIRNILDVLNPERDTLKLDTRVYSNGLVFSSLAKEVFPRRNKEVIPFKNGVFNIKTRKLSAHSPKNYLTSVFDGDYDPTIKDDTIVRALKKTACNDQAIFDMLLVVFAEIIARRRYQKKGFVFYGPKANNGKSTIMTLATYLTGKQYTANLSVDAFKPGSFLLESVINTDLIVVAEAQRYWGNADIIKSLLGYDEVQVNRKNRPAMSLTFIGNMIIATNNEMQFSETGNAIDTRFIKIPFNARFESASDYKKKVETGDTENVHRAKELITYDAENRTWMGQWIENPQVIAGFINYILALPKNFIEEAIDRFEHGDSNAKNQMILSHWNANDTLSFLSEHLYFITDKAQLSCSLSREELEHLYQSEFSDYCQSQGIAHSLQNLTLRAFKAKLTEMLKDLGLPTAAKKTKSAPDHNGKRHNLYHYVGICCEKSANKHGFPSLHDYLAGDDEKTTIVEVVDLENKISVDEVPEEENITINEQTYDKYKTNMMYQLEPILKNNNEEQFAQSLAKKKATYIKWKNIVKRLKCKITLNQYEEKFIEDFARKIEYCLKNSMGYYCQRSLDIYQGYES